MIDKNSIIEVLRARQADLQAAGVKHLSLFGSFATGRNSARSDIDLAAEYDAGLDLFDRGGVASDIADYLGTDNFDLADATRLKHSIQATFDNEHIRIF